MLFFRPFNYTVETSKGESIDLRLLTTKTGKYYLLTLIGLLKDNRTNTLEVALCRNSPLCLNLSQQIDYLDTVK